jgi:isopenicillin-N N-acyltransferase-like protein
MRKPEPIALCRGGSDRIFGEFEMPKHTEPVPIIYVKGTPRAIGRQIGEAARGQIQHCLEVARQMIAVTYPTLALTWDGATIQGHKYIPFVMEHYPQYVEELRGMGEGAGISFEDMVVLTSMEAVTMDALHLDKCTSIAANGDRTDNGHVLVGHNEDWTPEDEMDIYVVHAEPDNEPPFLAMTYGGYPLAVGFNAHGIAQCCDSVYPNDVRIGVPRLIVARSVLAAASPSEAIRRCLIPQRAAGYNHLIVHDSGEIYSVEVSARQFALLYGEDGTLAHTNYYIDPRMAKIEANPDELIPKRIRHYRASRLLAETEKHNIRSMQSILRDHMNFPHAVCNHDVDQPDPFSRESTICSMVMDLTARAMHIAWGNPCENIYHTYYLNA